MRQGGFAAVDGGWWMVDGSEKGKSGKKKFKSEFEFELRMGSGLFPAFSFSSLSFSFL